ncbi:MAG: UvrD-helicase domain-containing protein [Clostridiales bacterium]|nr:UvrD-helicase domain-containing protein [Clostridiales bacterium]
MPEFNAEQKAAIYADNPSLLCAAGAGSGKTTVMVESVVRKLAEYSSKDISGFLIITFTNEAAGNMKKKIQERLSAEAGKGGSYAARALANLENATISTIHSFCNSLISNYFYAIDGMSPKVSIIEDARLERLFREAYDAALEDIFDEKNESYSVERAELVGGVMDSFSQSELVETLRELYKALMGIPDPFERLDGYIDAISSPLEKNIWAREVQMSVDMDLMRLEDLIRQEKHMICPVTPPRFEEIIGNDESVIKSLLENLENISGIQEKIDAVGAARDRINANKATITKKDGEEAKEWNESFKKIRGEIKNSDGILGESVKKLEKLLLPKNAEDNLRMQNTLRGISVLLRAAADKFRALKLSAGGIDYSDMEQMAYELMKRDDIREAVRESITDIYVDECQDVSAIQYAVIDALTGDGRSLFRVGDVKQSIYGFRSAAPDIMNRDIQRYSADENAGSRKIFFRENYRSCTGIIDCVNEVFDTSMDKRISEMDYAPEDHLKANAEGDHGPVRVILLSQDDSEVDPLEAQCEAAGRQIEDLVVNKGREFKDIVILIKNARTDAPVMVDHFRKMHIPVMYDGGQSFYGLTEISSFLALLTVIDNDHTDVELVGALKGSPFDFSDTDLAEIRKAHLERSWFYEAFQTCCERNETALDGKCLKAREQIREWREHSRSMSASEFIWLLLRESGIYAVRGAYPDGRLRQLNLDTLYQRALEMEKRGIFRLSDFLTEIGKLRDGGSGDSGDTPAVMGGGDNLVRLMTMHKSKGLEFPVVILMNLQKNLLRAPSSGKMKIDVGTGEDPYPPLGVYIPVISREKHTKRDTFGHEAFGARERRASIAENTRLLYVAMTRAMQDLIMIGGFSAKDADLWRETNKASRIWQTRSMLDLIMPAVMKHVELPDSGAESASDRWLLSVQEPRKIRSAGSEVSGQKFDERIAKIISGGGAAPSVMWLGEDADGSPLKTSVTSLLRSGLELRPDEYQPPEEEETVEIKRRPETPGFLLSETAPRPAFMEEEKASAVDVGSITHRFLRLIDLSLFRGSADHFAAVRKELSRMSEKGIVTEAEARVIYVKGVADFLKSGLGRRLVSSDEIRREWPFTMRLKEDSPTMVQGIVDAAFTENGRWVLIDYKTDRDTRPEVFIPRHEKQMNWYRIAVERLTGREVKEMWLFALRDGKAYRVERQEV